MHKLRPAIITYLLLVLLGCENPEEPTVSGMSFSLKSLEGRWEDTNRENAFYEEWTAVDEFNMEGTGYVIAVGDTVFIERLDIVSEDDALYYVVGLSSNQQIEPVRFKMTSENASQITFEKPDHDFPKKIIYALKGDNNLEVFLNGHEAGKYTEITFSFRRRP